MIISMYSWTKR